MNRRERALLALTIVGFLVPNAMVGIFFIDHGLDFSAYLNDWVQTLPAAQLIVDLSIVFLAFALWSAWEGRRIGMRSWWVTIPASLLVGVCFAIPLFLLLRERAVRKQATRPQDVGAPTGVSEAKATP
jgi:membrane protease YdiL (CAAX protease family)